MKKSLFLILLLLSTNLLASSKENEKPIQSNISFVGHKLVFSPEKIQAASKKKITSYLNPRKSNIGKWDFYLEVRLEFNVTYKLIKEDREETAKIEKNFESPTIYVAYGEEKTSFEKNENLVVDLNEIMNDFSSKYNDSKSQLISINLISITTKVYESQLFLSRSSYYDYDLSNLIQEHEMSIDLDNSSEDEIFNFKAKLISDSIPTFDYYVTIYDFDGNALYNKKLPLPLTTLVEQDSKQILINKIQPVLNDFNTHSGIYFIRAQKCDEYKSTFIKFFHTS